MSKYSPNQAKHLRELGVYLRQQRLECSLSLEQIAATTFVRLPMLQAIEEGQFDSLPELVYVQGFIRRYADALKLDGNALAKQISLTEESVAVDIPPQLISTASASPSDSATAEPPTITRTAQKSPIKTTTSVAQKKTSSAANGQAKPSPHLGFKGLKLYWLYLLLLGGAIAGLFYLISRSESPESVQKTASPTFSSPQIKEPASLSSPITNAPAPPKTTPPTSVTSPSPAPSASPTVKASPVTVSVKLQEASWLKVQVDGKTAYEGILEKDTQQTWSGQKQVTLRAGNAGAVNLSVNQQAAQPLGAIGEVKEVIITPENGN